MNKKKLIVIIIISIILFFLIGYYYIFKHKNIEDILPEEEISEEEYRKTMVTL